MAWLEMLWASDNPLMHPTTDAAPLHPFATLTPDVVLDALASVGLWIAAGSIAWQF